MHILLPKELLLLKEKIIEIEKNRSLAFKNNAPFISSISKINNAVIDNAEDLAIVMPMYNLFHYSKNYRKTQDSLWNYYRDEPVDNNSPTLIYNADPITNSTSFKYKSSIIGKALNNNHDDNNPNKAGIIVPLKHLSSFWETLNMPLINCEVNLILTWSKNYVLTGLITRAAVGAQGGNPARPATAAPTGAIFTITDTKLLVPAVTLSAQDDNKLLEQLKTRFRRAIKV